MEMTFDTAGARRSPLIGVLLDQVRELLNKPQMRQANKRDLRELGYLDDRLIRDIGFNPSDIRKNDPFLNGRDLGAF